MLCVRYSHQGEVTGIFPLILSIIKEIPITIGKLMKHHLRSLSEYLTYPVTVVSLGRREKDDQRGWSVDKTCTFYFILYSIF